MIIGRSYWIIIWYGILLLGVLGIWSSLYWGRQTGWQNFDEVLRATGTVTVSIGMLILLYGVFPQEVGEVLLVIALLSFIGAFVLGRRAPRSASSPDSDDEEEPPPTQQD